MDNEAQAPTFGVVNDRTGEVRDIELSELEAAQGEGFRVENVVAYQAAVDFGQEPAGLAPVSAGQAMMEMQGAADASMTAINDRGFMRAAEQSEGEVVDESSDAEEAFAKAEESGFFDRQDAVEASTVSMYPEEVVAARNRGRRALRGEPVGSLEDEAKKFSGEARKAKQAAEEPELQEAAEAEAVANQAPEGKDS